MRLKFMAVLIMAIAVSIAFPRAHSQVSPQANKRSFPLSVGGGISSFDVDWGHGRMLGPTLWADWYPGRLPAVLQGLGVEAEAREIIWNRQSTKPPNFLEEAIGGGLIYSWRHYQHFQPYGKYLVQLGSMDFRIPSVPTYTHDTRQVYSPGVGFQYYVAKGVSARADYEYQFWPNLFARSLNPQGFTFGAMYSFEH